MPLESFNAVPYFLPQGDEFLFHFTFRSWIPFATQEWIYRRKEVVIYQNPGNLFPKLKMFLNVICLNYWKLFCPAEAVLAGVPTSSGVLCVTRDPLETCSWERMGLYDTLSVVFYSPFSNLCTFSWWESVSWNLSGAFFSSPLLFCSPTFFWGLQGGLPVLLVEIAAFSNLHSNTSLVLFWN